MKKLLFPAIFAGLSACDTLPTLNLKLPSLGEAKSETEAVVTRDNVTLTAPRGFCVDPQSSTLGAASAFVVFGNCAAITKSKKALQPSVNAILTSTVRPADPSLPKIKNSTAQLSEYFNSDVGHVLLSRSNDTNSVDVLESGTNTNGAFFLYVKDTSSGAPEGTQDTYWRAYFDAKNSVVTISVLSLDSNPLSRSEGLAILRQFSEAIQSVPSNSTDAVLTETPNNSPATQTRPTQRPASATEPQKTLRGFLGRLFG